MRPSYFINSTYYCDDDKSKPKRLPQYISDNHLLKTSDIEGAQAGYRSEHFLSIPNSMRKEFRNTNFINDIEGAQANTKKSTFVTTRCSNPLQPVYKSLDGDALIGGPVDGLVPADLIDKNTYNFKSFGTIPQSSSGIKSSNPPISRRSLSAATSRDSNGSSQYIQPEESKLNFISTSTTSQYFDMDSSQERRNSDDIAAKSYAEKIHMDSKFLITEIPLQSQNQNNHHDKSSNHSSSNQQPRRSLSAVPRLSRDLGVSLQATNNSSRIVSSRRNEPHSNCSSQVSTSRSHQSSGRKLRSDSLSSKRQQAELDAEISAIRGL